MVDPLHADASSYTSYAWNLREFGVYSRTPEWAQRTGASPTADTVSPPGYPLFLTLFLDGRPDRAFVQRVTQLWQSLRCGRSVTDPDQMRHIRGIN